MKSIRILTAVFGFTALTCAAWSQVPQLINYQGRVTVGGTNFNGTGQFKFCLIDPAGPDSYWSNDGTGPEGEEPDTAVPVTVTKGLYSVLLGDTTLSNMIAIPPAVFNNSDVWLRVWFDDGVNGFQLLSPDQRIAAVGYAMMAANVADGAITTAKIAAGAVGSAQISSGAVLSNAVSTTNGITLGVTVPGSSTPSAPLTMIASGTGSTRTTNSIRLFGSRFNIGSTGNSNNIWHSGTLSGGGGALTNINQLGGGSSAVLLGGRAHLTLTNGTTVPNNLVLTNPVFYSEGNSGGGTNESFGTVHHGPMALRAAIDTVNVGQQLEAAIGFQRTNGTTIAKISTGVFGEPGEYMLTVSMALTSNNWNNVLNWTSWTNGPLAGDTHVISCSVCGNAPEWAQFTAQGTRKSAAVGLEAHTNQDTMVIRAFDMALPTANQLDYTKYTTTDYGHRWRFGMAADGTNYFFSNVLSYNGSSYEGPTNIIFNTVTGDITAAGTITSLAGGFRFPDGTVQTTAATGGLGITGEIELLTGTTDNAGLITNYFSPGLILVDASFNPTNVLGRWASLVSIRTNRAIYHVFNLNAIACNNCTVVGPARAYAQ